MNTSSSSLQNQINAIFSKIYPVNSIYIGTMTTCPIAALITGSTWQTVATNIVVNVNTNVPVKGNGIALGLTNGTQSGAMSRTSTGNVGGGGYALNISAASLGTSVGSAADNLSVTTKLATGLTTDASKSGIVGTVTRTNLTVNIWKRTA